jgi:hypothetical protein
VKEASGQYRKLAAAAAVICASGALYFVSRGKWSDPIIDSGREWIVPDALSRGELLYRDVVYWFGPFTPYAHAALFRFFGSSFSTLALAGAAAGSAALYALHRALRLAAGSRAAAPWTAIAVPLLLFMPSAGGVFLGMGLRMWHAALFSLLAVTLSAPASERRRPALDLAAGAAAGMAGLCRTEWGAAALAGVAAASALRAPGGLRFSPLGRAAAGFAVVFGGGLGLFVLLAGAPAVLRDAPVLLWNLPAETRASSAAAHPGSWARGAGQMAYGAFAWLAVFVAIEVLSLSRVPHPSDAAPGIARRRLPLLGALLALAGASAAVAGLPQDVVLCATPLLCAAAAVFAAVRMPRGSRAAAVAGCGVLGLLTAYRRPFFLADGPYVAPPILFAIVCAAGLLAAAVERREPSQAGRLSAALTSAAWALAAVLFVVRGLQYREDDRVAIAGTAGMLSAREATARRIEAAAGDIRAGTEPSAALVVFPEGEILNFLAGRRNPIRHKLYLPGYLTSENEEEILAELERSPPAAVVLWPRPLGEYGRGEFGADYGRRIRGWIAREYAERRVGTEPGRAPVIAFRKTGLR